MSSGRYPRYQDVVQWIVDNDCPVLFREIEALPTVQMVAFVFETYPEKVALDVWRKLPLERRN